MDNAETSLKTCAKESCDCCGYKKIKVKVGGKTRKLKVYRSTVLKSIKSVIGELSYISYIDDDSDKVCCYTEKEATMAIFDDNVTFFVIERSAKGTKRLQNRDSVVVKVDENVCIANGDALSSANTESRGNDVLSSASMSTLTFVSTYMRESGIEGCAKKPGLNALQNACDAFSREHLSLYGIECLFTCTIKERGPLVTCSICSSKLNATNVSNVKSHFLSSQTHRANVNAITNKTSSADTTDKIERLMVSAKRYIYSKGLQNELYVEENSSRTKEGCILCLLCTPPAFVNLTGHGSYVERIDSHVNSRNHKNSKVRRNVETRCKGPRQHKEHE